MRGDGFTVTADAEVALSSKGNSKLPIPLRRIEIRRDEDAKTIVVITNDLTRSALEMGEGWGEGCGIGSASPPSPYLTFSP